MSLSAQLYKSIRSMPNCIAGGYIDLENDEMVSMLSVDTQSEEVLERLVGITRDLFQGPNVLMIEDIFKKRRDINDDSLHYFKEIVVMNEGLAHVFLRGQSYKGHAVTFVSRGETNVVLSLVKARVELKKLEAALRADRAKIR